MVMAGRQLCLAPSVHTQTHTLAAQGKEGLRVEQDESGFYLSLYPNLSLNTETCPFSIHLVPTPIFLVSQKTFQLRTIGLQILNYPLQYLPQPLLAKPLAVSRTSLYPSLTVHFLCLPSSIQDLPLQSPACPKCGGTHLFFLFWRSCTGDNMGTGDTGKGTPISPLLLQLDLDHGGWCPHSTALIQQPPSLETVIGRGSLEPSCCGWVGPEGGQGTCSWIWKAVRGGQAAAVVEDPSC